MRVASSRLVAQAKLDSLLRLLESVPPSDVMTNPYRESSNLENLRVYFSALLDQSVERTLLVGEAPGYRGCRNTGIPFSSSRLLKEHPHPFWKSIRDSLTVENMEAEATATVVWNSISGVAVPPVFWNAFPFHRHKKGDLNTNRVPNPCELRLGQLFLYLVHDLFKPVSVVGIGRKGEEALNILFPHKPAVYIRHPSNGGKKMFLEGIRKLGL